MAYPVFVGLLLQKAFRYASAVWWKEIVWDDFRLLVLAGATAAVLGALCSAAHSALAGRKPFAYVSFEERLLGDVKALHSGEIVEGEGPSFVETVEINRLAAENDGRGQLVDLRPELFYEEAHIPGAVNLSLENFVRDYKKNAGNLERFREGGLILYCSNSDCRDSLAAARALAKLGYRNIRIYRGGWEEWAREVETRKGGR